MARVLLVRRDERGLATRELSTICQPSVNRMRFASPRGTARGGSAVKHHYRLMHLPSIERHSYVLVTSQGDAVAVRYYPDETSSPRILRPGALAEIEAEARRGRARVIEEEPKRVELSAHWWRRIQAANRRADLGPSSSARLPPAPTASPELAAPHQPRRLGRFVNHLGSPLATLADWQALHPAVHWKAGYSAMELARAWHHADGLPPAVAGALASAPFGPFVVDRAIAECRTSVPGVGRPSHTDLMVEAVDAAGGRVVIAVEGKVSELFGPLVGAWLRKVDHGRSAANKLERLRGLCDALGLPMGADTEALRYQLLHRTWAAMSHAKSVGAPRAVVLVHSFAPPPDYDNRAAFGAFLKAMGQAAFSPGAVLPLGRRMGIDLWAAWVSDSPLAG